MRTRGHDAAKELMVRSDHRGALVILADTLQRYGDHVGPLADVACCRYLLGDFSGWRTALARLRAAVEAAEAKLSSVSRVRSWLMIAKYTEESGEIAEARHIYERELAELASSVSSSAELLRCCLTQLVRVKGQYGIRSGLAADYAQLVRSGGWNPSSADGAIEVEHALMLAEAELFGLEHARERLRRLNVTELAEHDQRLVAIDFIEMMLAQGQLLASVPTLPEKACPDHYESEILRLYHNPSYVPALAQLNRVSETLPLAGELRLLRLISMRANNPTLRVEIRRRGVFLIEALSSESRQMWQSLLRGAIRAGGEVIVFCLSHSEIIYLDRRLALGRKKGIAELLMLIIPNSVVPLDDAIKRLWGANIRNHESHFERIRLRALRASAILEDITGIPKLISVTKSEIRLAAPVAFKPCRCQDCEVQRQQIDLRVPTSLAGKAQNFTPAGLR